MKPTAAVVGCGSISRFHFAALEAIGIPITWIHDLSEPAARPMLAKTGAAFAPTLEMILNDPEVRVVHVLTGSPSHADLCRRIIPTGKAVICEKTLTTSADDSLELLRLARLHATLLYTGYMKRFLPAVQQAKQLLPRIGPVISCHARVHQCWGPQWGAPPTDPSFVIGPDGMSRVFRNNGGGILVCGGSHMIDLILHLLGRPRSLFAEVHVPPGRDYDIRATALMHTADGVIHFESLCSPHTHAGFQHNGWDETIELIGTHGKLKVFSPQWDRTDVLPSLLHHYDNSTQQHAEYYFAAEPAFTREMAALYENIAAGRQGDPPAYSGYEVDEVIHAMLASSKLRQAIEINWRADR